jgi:uncharacterized pyridoxal phosphate-containing UPF0001 family protein
MKKESLAQGVRTVKASLPPHVLLVAAAKTRTSDEVKTAIASGITAIGYNYVQEAEAMLHALKEWETREASHQVQWHLIA